MIRSRKYIPSDKRGFSLTEIALALLVIGVGMTAILAVFPVALNLGANSTQQARMILLGEEILSELRVKAMDPQYNDWSWSGSGAASIVDAIDDGLLDVALPFADEWNTTDTPEKIKVRRLGHGVEHQQIWYIDEQSGIDSHNVGVRVTVFPPSNEAYRAGQEGKSLNVEVALWADGGTGEVTISFRGRDLDPIDSQVRRSEWVGPGSPRLNSVFKVFSPDVRVFGEIKRNQVVFN